MMNMIRCLLKNILTYYHNWHAIVRMNSFGRKCFIGKGLEVNSPEGISISDNTHIGKNCRLSCYKGPDGLGSIIVKPCMICSYVTILSANKVTIEKGALLASHISIISYNHGTNPEQGCYGSQPLYGKDITIGRYSWIGEKVIICPGVKIGERSIIGAGSVVTQSIPPYCIAVGNPAKVIKKWSFKEHKWLKYNE